jgi:hypothetical protein
MITKQQLNMEIWKDIVGYENLYQVSNLGNVKSLPKEWISSNGARQKHNGKLLKLCDRGEGYLAVNLYNNGVKKFRMVHQLVAEAFLNHKPNGLKLIVDHINDDPSDNKMENLQIVTQRFNVCKTQGRYSSNLKGVYKSGNRWKSQIVIDKKIIYLGTYINEIDAHLAYKNKLETITQ